MSARRLTPEQALHEALLALGSARPGEVMTDVSFWTFAEHLEGIGGGAGWRVVFARQLGLDARPLDAADAQARWQRTAIESWRRRFYPDPERAPAVPRTTEAT